MNITRVKERFIIVIKLSLRKRQMDYKRASWLQIMQAKTTIKKKGGGGKATLKIYFFFITILSFVGALVDWVSVASEDFGPLPLRSPLAGTGRIAKEISILKDTTFTLGGS